MSFIDYYYIIELNPVPVGNYDAFPEFFQDFKSCKKAMYSSDDFEDYNDCVDAISAVLLSILLQLQEKIENLDVIFEKNPYLEDADEMMDNDSNWFSTEIIRFYLCEKDNPENDVAIGRIFFKNSSCVFDAPEEIH